MSQPQRRELLRAATGTALAKVTAFETQGQAARPARPGDLFVMRQTRDLPVEWLVLRSGEQGRAFVIAADSYPATGSSDVAVPVSAAAGPLYLRCGFGTWLDPADLEPELRTGSVEEIYLGHAQRKLLQLEQTDTIGSWSERSTDEDLDYRDWRRDVLTEALLRLTEAPAERPAPAAQPVARRRIRPVWVGLAAAGLAVLALSVQNLQLRQQNHAFAEPSINSPEIEIHVLDPARSSEPALEIPRSARWVSVFLILPDRLDHPLYRVALLEADGTLISKSDETPPANGFELSLVVPTVRLHDGLFYLLVEGGQLGRFEQVSREPLRIRFFDPRDRPIPPGSTPGSTQN